LGLSLDKLKTKFSERGLTPLDAKRVFPWIHLKLAKTFDVMSDVPKSVREALPRMFSLERPWCVVRQTSADGAQKALLELKDAGRIETVFIPDDSRNTICVSSQIGCPIGCKFCRTGSGGFCRNLTADEIMAQVFFWKDVGHNLSNIVFMGMGEPLLNPSNLFSALRLLLDRKTHNFSRNKITVSTSGILDESIVQLAEFGVKLAVSLHATNDSLRSDLMPINRKYGIDQILEASRKYLAQSNSDRITFEYLLLSGINDRDEDAQRLSKLLNGMACKVNLIMFNGWDGSGLIGSAPNRAHRFLRILLRNGLRAIIRKSRGDDISAACGQLLTEQIFP
jgi:23S rRNA (adenine2503-C2)-methyltransferase